MKLSAAVQERKPLQRLCGNVCEHSLIAAAPVIHDALQRPTIHVFHHQSHTTIFDVAECIVKINDILYTVVRSRSKCRTMDNAAVTVSGTDVWARLAWISQTISGLGMSVAGEKIVPQTCSKTGMETSQYNYFYAT